MSVDRKMLKLSQFDVL